MVNFGKITHMIFEGLSGVGKTTVALVIAKHFFGDFIKSNFIELNASDERGIDVVRDTIKNFAKTLPLNSSFKIVLLDEGDEMTNDAQNALRRTMEKYSDICIFIFAVNNVEKIIPAIQSRCEIFHFAPLSVSEISERLFDIYQKEKLDLQGSELISAGPALEKIAEYSQGDMRKALNHLQVLLASLSKGEQLTEDKVESIKPTDFGKLIFDALQKGRFFEARQQLYKAWELGYVPRALLTLIHNVYIQEEIPISVKADAIFELAECDYRMTQGVDKVLAFDKLLLKLLVKQ
jgi:replication factor C small subunit